MYQANNNGVTPLSISSKKGHQEVVKLLLARIATIRRFAVLSAIRQVRRSPSTPPPSQLLSLLAENTPDDLVRVILEFLGEDGQETVEQKLARLEKVEKSNREMRRRNGEMGREIAELRRENAELEGEGGGGEEGRKRKR